MKLDGEQLLFQVHRLDSKPFDCNVNALESVALKPINGTVKENHDEILCNVKGGKIIVDQFQCPSCKERELPELIICYREETCSVVKDICVDDGVPSQDKFLFDTGVEENSTNPFLAPEDDLKTEKINKAVVTDATKSVAETERMDGYPLTSDFPELCGEDDFKSDLLVESDSKNVVTNTEAKDGTVEEIDRGGSKEVFSLGELLSMPDFGMELLSLRPSNDNIKEVDKRSVQNSGTSTSAMNAAHEESKSCSKVTSMTSSILLSGAEHPRGEDETILQSNSAPSSAGGKLDHSLAATMLPDNDTNSVSTQSDKCQEGPVLVNPLVSSCEESENVSNEASPALHFSSEYSTSTVTELKTGSSTSEAHHSASVGNDEANPEHGDCKPIKSQRSTSEEDANTDPVSSQIHQYGPGESSFSAAAPPVTGLISYSGPIAYSGSMSLRSESSTTSTHSFAFPILQSEWNASPVRMVKAERRHRGWRHTLLCCRF